MSEVVAAPLTLYWRDGCHLCEDMERTLAELVHSSRYRLTRIDIDGNEDLRRRYNGRWLNATKYS